jgi:hypothetical protein
MSEQAPEAPPRKEGGGGGKSTFTRKLGPLPLWAWMGVGLAVVLVYANWQKSKQGASSTGTGSAAGATSVNSPGGVDASLVPQFINQTYVQDQPPTAPNITVNNTVPTPVTKPPPSPAKTPEPSTISGAPGSFTTGLQGGLNEWTSTGQYSLNTIAKSHGMTAQQLIAVSNAAENNVPLKNYVAKNNLNAPLPSGVQIFIPNANWKMVS